MLDQRRRRWAGVVQMLYKCFVFAGDTFNNLIQFPTLQRARTKIPPSVALQTCHKHRSAFSPTSTCIAYISDAIWQTEI